MPQSPSMLSPEQLRQNYNRAMERIGDKYISVRWGNSPTQRRHFLQTQSSLAHALSSTNLGVVLEVGCGPAVWTPMVLGPSRRMTLLDISDEMLSAAKRALGDEPKVDYLRADFVEADLSAASFDTALSVRAFEYMPDKPAALRQFARVLRPGATLILVTKSAGWRDHVAAQRAVAGQPVDQIPDTVRMQAGVIGWAALRSMALESGFATAEVSPTVIGSYSRFSRTRPALWFFDRLHARTYRRPMVPALDPLTESVTLVARVPGR